MEPTSRDPRRLTISPPRPLHLRKKSKAHLDRSHEEIHSQHEAHLPTSRLPPRTSSQRNNKRPDKSHLVNTSDSESGQVTPVGGRVTRSALADSVKLYLASPSIESHSTVSDIKGNYLSDSSSPILGDFVPFEKSNINSSSVLRGDGLNLSESPAKTVQRTRPAQKINPYQFEPDTPDLYEERRQSTIANFTRKHDSSSVAFSSPRMAHFKNSHSAGSEIDMENLSPSAKISLRPSRSRIQRSGSSPNLGAIKFAPQEDEYDPPDLRSFPREYGVRGTQSRGQSLAGTTTSSGRHHVNRYESPPRLTSAGPARREVYDASPTLQGHIAHSYRQESTFINSLYNCHATRSPDKTSGNVYARSSNTSSNGSRYPAEGPGYQVETSNQATKSPPRRSRSPMKKLFGEKGFFGETSPDDVKVKHEVPKVAPSRANTESFDGGKKTSGIMGRLKNKLEEFAEKADITPKNSRTSNDKSARHDLLAISLGPPEQARISMEVELMLVHTANGFLMAQFSAGRMSVDSIKKTVDTWKSKGRPGVIEFMYDQATQRDLVSLNQYEFRFYGERAGDNIRINSMLYNWKQVANLMSVRTFCNADTILLKLLFDIEQILEFLGAGEAIMLRVQQIRARVMELMRVARLSNGVKAQTISNQQPRDVSNRHDQLYESRPSAQFDGRDDVPYESHSSAVRSGREE